MVVTCTTPGLRKQSQEDQKFEVILSYIGSSWATGDLVYKRRKEERGKEEWRGREKRGGEERGGEGREHN